MKVYLSGQNTFDTFGSGESSSSVKSKSGFRFAFGEAPFVWLSWEDLEGDFLRFLEVLESFAVFLKFSLVLMTGGSSSACGSTFILAFKGGYGREE